MLERQLRHQNRLLGDLLDVSRITRGKVLLRLERLDLRDMVQDTIQDHRALLEAVLEERKRGAPVAGKCVDGWVWKDRILTHTLPHPHPLPKRTQDDRRGGANW